MKYRALFLDFYGTLVEEDYAVISTICRELTADAPELAKPFSQRWSELFSAQCQQAHGDAFRTQREIEVNSLSQAMTELGLSSDPVAESQRLYDYWARPTAFPESAAFLRECPLPICILSNIDTADLEAALRHNDWSFDNIITSESARSYKPRAEMFQAALALMGVPPQEALHVGDSTGSDVRGAIAAGIDVAWVNRSGRQTPTDIKPSHVVCDLSELLKFLTA